MLTVFKSYLYLVFFVLFFLAYPLAFLHRKYMYGKYYNVQHLFFIICGSYIGYFNYGTLPFIYLLSKEPNFTEKIINFLGWQLMHAYICILIQYVVVWLTSGTLFSVVFAFVFQMGYLLAGLLNYFFSYEYLG